MSLLSPNLFNQNNHSLTEDFSLIIPENLEKITIISDMINGDTTDWQTMEGLIRERKINNLLGE